MTQALLIAALMLALVGTAKAGVEEGVIAYQEGDFATALSLLEPEAEAGDPTAQFHLGLMYDFGEGVANDFAAAARWYRKAAEQGHGDAQYNIGVLYYTGKGVAKDVAEAARWFKLAADQGNVFAQNNMATLSAEGQGVPKDLIEAYKWFDLAAEEIPISRVYRDQLALRMTPGQVAEAKQRADAWRAGQP
jgi:hypothetical protein